MLDLAFLGILGVWSIGVGLWVLRRFGPWPEEPLDTLALALPLGLGSLGLAVFGLGEIGALGAGQIRWVLNAGAVVGLLGVTGWLRQMRRLGWNRQTPVLAVPPTPILPHSGGGKNPFSHLQRRLGEGGRDPSETAASPHLPVWPDRLLAAFVLTALLGTLLTALAPVTDGDALCYHLQVSRRFLERGGLFFDPDLHETVYPLLVEMLDTVALALRGPVACRLIQWLFGVAFALNVAALARPLLQRRAWWAGAVALLVPAVSNGMSAPLNDVALAALGTAALVAWSRFSDRPSWRSAALTGMLIGLAMGVKYPALVLAGLIGLAIGPGLLARSFFRMAARGTGVSLLGARRAQSAVASVVDRWSAPDDAAPRRGRFRHALVFALAAWLAGGMWYARAFWYTGNPVHPFFKQAFGGAGLDEVLGPEKRPLAVNPLNLLTALGPLTLEPDRFDSFSHQFGPVFLLFLPALLLERPPRRLLAIAGMGYTFLALCLTQRQSMRFVLTALGPLAVAVAWLAQRWWERRSVPGRALVGVLLLTLGFESGLALARARHGLSVVLGFESADHYLARHEPTFQVGRWIDAHLPSSSRIVGQDHRGYYIPRPYTMELAHRRRTGLGQKGEPAAAIVATLRREGFTHVLLCPPEPETAVEFDGTLSRRLTSWIQTHDPLFRDNLADGDGVVRHYALYDLSAPAVAQPPRDADVVRTSSAEPPP